MWSCCPLVQYFRTLCIVQAFNIHEEDSSFKLISSITSQVWHEGEGVVLETEVQDHEKTLCFPACFRDQAIDLSSMSQFVFTLHWQQCFCRCSSVLHLVSLAFLPYHCRNSI